MESSKIVSIEIDSIRELLVITYCLVDIFDEMEQFK